MRPRVPQCGLVLCFAASTRPQEQSRVVRTPQRLAAAERDQVEAQAVVRPEVLDGRHIGRRVQQCRNLVPSCQLYPFLPFDLAIRLGHIHEEHQRGPFADDSLDIGRRFDVNQLDADIGQLVVVAGVVRLLQDHFASRAHRAGQTFDEVAVAERHRGGGSQEQRARGAGRHQGRLDAHELRNPFADLVLQVEQVHKVPASVRPGGDYLGRHERTAQYRHGPGGVDDVLDANRLVDARLVGLCLRMSGMSGGLRPKGSTEGQAGSGLQHVSARHLSGPLAFRHGLASLYSIRLP